MSEQQQPMRTNEELINVRWQAAPENTIGGWCIQPEGEVSPADGGISLCDFIAEPLARHITDLHNKWLGQ